ncbi:hypothetical protein EDEG_02884 [Edhazardia aedis USNM 41457]|uniref:Uncharacterized protein n=1 Tax=Edhazardia aedis (strain USNM 41457) TaxID=1003232 RepID=J9DJB4_EDHAE|nr:hypothetical protein EDEG_02884 [Edhazardia aedis USNM 41457]|eukprot:EJW02700.1 hypothetical protein EDEG_02884 [Edhazardia aedis USNM 41457]
MNFEYSKATDSKSGQLTRTTRKLNKENKENEEIEELKRNNLKLRGEVSILRQNLLSVEKENYALKDTRNKQIVQKLDITDKLKKELKKVQLENKIKENQLRAYKKPRITNLTTTQAELETNKQLDLKFILKNINEKVVFSLYPFRYERLKTLHDYFYDEFEKLCDATDTIINEITSIKHDMMLFLKLFYLFCGKKEIFDNFFPIVIVLFLRDCEKYPKPTLHKITSKIYKILTEIDLGWVIKLIEDKEVVENMQIFLDNTYYSDYSIIFYKRIAKERPFILPILLGNERFDKILLYKELNNDRTFFDQFIDSIPESILKDFVTIKNIHLFSNKILKKIFKDLYISYNA